MSSAQANAIPLWYDSQLHDPNSSANGSTSFASGYRADFTAVPYATFIKNTDELSHHARSLLGKNCVDRFVDFTQYKDEWDSGRGHKLSTRSVAVLESFLSVIYKFPVEPSLFFTRNGNLELGWEDSSNGKIEIEFFPDRIEYFAESKSEEESIGIADFDIRTLVQNLMHA
jgi:hypothetical protein